MSGEEVSLEELLQTQQMPSAAATVEAVPGDDLMVKVTPFVASASGCACDFALNIPKSAIASLSRTGSEHYCCGQDLTVVNITVSDNAYTHMFEQMTSKASATRAPVLPRPGSAHLRLALQRRIPVRQSGPQYLTPQQVDDLETCLPYCDRILDGYDQLDSYYQCQARNAYDSCVAGCHGYAAHHRTCFLVPIR